ncbi:hypothetical protein ACFQZQ_08895 [Lysobacter koreensis]|uniref:Lipoprotein n=1 Tax=Lysobacter koreensis TaxID=266122 RepID=A0ABW2YMT1_9GAMM
MHLQRPVSTLLTAITLSLLLAACGGAGDKAGRNTVDGEADETLPAPEGRSGSITGMPDAPGPGQVGPPVPGETLPADVPLDENGNPLPLPPENGVVDAPVDNANAPINPETGDSAIAPDEPTVADAIAVVRDYYGAINARAYARAFALWSDGGRAAGQSPQQFADGFAQTEGVSVEIMEPGRVDAAAGARYVEVPIALTTTRSDGSERRYVGAYTLRRSVVGGATPEQRAWRIASADIREVRP